MAHGAGRACLFLLAVAFLLSVSGVTAIPDPPQVEELSMGMDLQPNSGFTSRAIRPIRTVSCVSYYAKAFNGEGGGVKTSLLVAETGEIIPGVNHTDMVTSNQSSLFYFEIGKQDKIFKLRMKAEPGPGKRQLTSLYDVQITRGHCLESQGTCDFERSACGYATSRTSSVKWERATGSSDSPQFPSVDATTGSSSGHYMKVNAKRGRNVELYSGNIHSNVSCVRFYYSIYGRGRLDVGVRGSNPKLKSFANDDFTDADSEPQWVFGQVEIMKDSLVYRLVFRAVAPPQDSHEVETWIALDDIKVRHNSCRYYKPKVPTVASVVTEEASCDFEGQCADGWTSRDGEAFQSWNLLPANKGKPRYDISIGSAKGHYQFVMFSLAAADKKAVLISPEFDRSQHNGRPNCVSFWYHIFSHGNPQLSLYFRWAGSQSEDAIWTSQGAEQDTWHQVFVQTPDPGRNNLAHLEFEATPNKLSKFAIDDVKVYDGPCPAREELCDFEQAGTLCGYQAPNKDWVRGDVPALEGFTGMKADHSTGTRKGSYVYANGTQTHSVDSTAAVRFESPLYHPTSGRCLQFFYAVQGAALRTVALEVLLQQEGGQTYAMQLTGEANDRRWKFTQADVFAGQYFQIIFVARSGVVSLDDIKMSKFSCADSVGCDFEQGQCAWSTSVKPSATTHWHVLAAEELPEGEIGPSKDVTLNSEFGHFLYLHSAAHVAPGSIAVLESLELDFGVCLTFHYSMPEEGAGTLSVNLTDFAGDAVPQTIWSKSGGQGYSPMWKRAKVDLVTQSFDDEVKDFRLDHIGTVGVKPGAGIAVDEIHIHDMSCKDVEDDGTVMDCPTLGQDGTRVVITRSRLCNFITECPNGEDELNCGTCDFGTESGFCNYRNVSSGEMAWFSAREVSRDHTSQIPTRPKDSNDTEHGNYLLVAHRYSSETGRMLAELEMTHEIGPTPSTCQLHFDLFMSAFSVDEPAFKVVLRQSSEDTVIFKGAYHYRSTFWNKVVVDIGSIDSRFKIAFRGHKEVGKINEGNVAIDDIVLVNCEYPPQKSTCKKSEFRCERGSCIDKIHTCDFTDDCGDRSDEEKNFCDAQPVILRTHFEQGMGNWTEESRPDAPAWVIQQGRDVENVDAHPGRDHTLGTLYGHFITVARGQRDVPAILTSPVLVKGSNENSCRLRLYYYINSNHYLTRFSVAMKTTQVGEDKVLLKRFTGHGQSWTRADIWVTPDTSDQRFQIVIKGESFDKNAFLALDDFSLWGCEISEDQTLPKGTMPPPPPCPAHQRACSNGTCLSYYRFCDLVNDCADGSDEKNCGTCDFEGDKCGWHEESHGVFSWVLRGAYQQMEPSFDATGQTEGKGHFMLLQPHSAGVDKEAAVFVSPILPETDPSCQISFSYYTNIEGSVRNLLVESQQREELDTQRYDIIPKTGGIIAPVGKWTRVTAKLGFSTASSRIYLKQKYQEFEKAPAIAIDDIKFEHCAKMSDVRNVEAWPALLACTFGSSGFCQYHPSYMASDYHWSHGQVRGPNGQYIQAARAGIWDGSKAGHKAYMTSQWISATEHPLCLKFYYMTFGTTLRVELLAPHSMYGNNAIFSHHGYENTMKTGYATVPPMNTPFLVRFVAILGQHSQSVFLWDLKVDKGNCPQSSLCDFETDDCGFKPESQETWARSGLLLYDEYLPSKDHTQDIFGGHFMGITGSVGTGPARLTKKNIQQAPGETSCTYFWYNMHGFDVGSLTVKLQREGSSPISTLWSTQGDQGDHWHQGRVQIPQDAGRYSLSFEAHLRGDEKEYMAVDDIQTVGGPCPQPGDCDFDSGMCGYTSHSVDESGGQETESRWLRLQYHRPLSPYGPLTNRHGGSNGGYALSDQFVKTFLDSAKFTRMVSPLIPRTERSCLTFWYYFKGEAKGALKVMTADTVVFETSIRTDSWRQSGLIEYSTDKAYRITFETERDSHAPASLAVDDIIVTQDACAYRNIPVAPSTGGGDQDVKKTPPKHPPSRPQHPPSRPDPGSALNCDDYCTHWTRCFHAGLNAGVKCVCQDGYRGEHCNQYTRPHPPSGHTDEKAHAQSGESGGSDDGWKAPVAILITMVLGLMLAFGVFVFLVRTDRVRAPERLQRLLPSVFSQSSSGGGGLGDAPISYSKGSDQGIMNPVYESNN